MANVFSNVQNLNPKRSKFDLSHTVDFDCKIGECIPILFQEMVPGDKFSLSNITKVRFQPLVAPISDELEVKIDYAFVAERLIFNDELDGVGNNFESFITQVPEIVEGSPSFPVVKPKWNVTKNTKYSLWDYFGFPVGVAPQGKSAPCDDPKRAYNLFWNQYLRDENLQQEVDITTNEDILWSNVQKDYFTSAFTQRQRGPSVGLPVSSTILTNTIPLSLSMLYDNKEYSYDFDKLPITFGQQQAFFDGREDPRTTVYGMKFGKSGNDAIIGKAEYPDDVPSNYRTNVLSSDSNGRLYIDANNVQIGSTAFDISDLRFAKSVQRWQERSLMGGVRYTEFLRSFFGVSPRDDRLQRCEYICGVRSPVIVQDIIQQSQTTESSAQATEAGHMISADGNKLRSYFAQEFGWLIGILRIVPKIKYTNGINRQFLRNTPFDYYFPTFANLSEQGIYNEEVFAVDDEDANLGIWGYQGVYNEMRYSPNRVVAGLRDSNGFLFWTMARKFTSLPNLNENFISTEFMQNDFMRVFQIVDENLTRPCIVHVWNGIKALRPMPFLPTPL